MRPVGEHVLIIGAGVVGLGVGWQLLELGHRVSVVERNTAGSGASNAAAGMLAPTAEVTFQEEALLALSQRSRTLYPEFVARLQEVSGHDVDYRTSGTLVVGLDRDDTEALEHLLAYQLHLGLGAERLSGDAARELEPALSPNVHSAIHCPSDHHIDPTGLMGALRAAFLLSGGTLREGEGVQELKVAHQRCTGCVLESGEEVAADAVLVAAGAWTRALGGVERRQLPRIRPVRGQMLSLWMPRAQPLCERVIRAPDAYLVPRSDGRLIIGATMEEMGFDTSQTAGGIFELLRGAWEAMPGIYDLPFERMWTGFRPISLSNEPVLGPSEDIKGLWFATGHGRNGILLTPLTAMELSHAMHTGTIPEVLREFVPR